MKIVDDIKIDFTQDKRMYEVTIECRNDNEVDKVFAKFQGVKNYVVEMYEDLEITVVAESWRHFTKKDFIKSIRKIIK